MKQNTTIIILTLIALAGAALFWSTGSKDQEAQSAALAKSSAELVAETSQYDFGDIDIFGGKVSTEYTLKNEGAEDVTITSGETSCMCTEGEVGELRFGMHGSNKKIVVIPTGGSEMVTAIFDPLAHGPNGTGKITRELVLKTNSSETPEIRLRFAANVIKK